MATSETTPARHAFDLEFICRLEGELEPIPQVIGPTAEGLRINFPIAGGRIHGPKVNGTVLPGGADFYCLRTDGVSQIDVRATAKTDDGALLYVTYTGVADLGEDGYAKGLEGKMPNPIRLQVAPRIRTAHPNYAWMNRIQFIGIGESVPGSNLVVSYIEREKRPDAGLEVHARAAPRLRHFPRPGCPPFPLATRPAPHV